MSDKPHPPRDDRPDSAAAAPAASDTGQVTPASKSARKRAHAALQALAAEMAALSDAALAKLGVDDQLRRALADLRAMQPSGARNRQLRYCARFLDGADLREVRAYLDDSASHRLAENRFLHGLEAWRDRLITTGDAALGELLDRYPDVDRQRLRQAVRDARRERTDGRPAGAARRLFRLLREAGVGRET